MRLNCILIFLENISYILVLMVMTYCYDSAARFTVCSVGWYVGLEQSKMENKLSD